jgi:hypothetical protein
MKSAKICDEWTLDFHIDVKQEDASNKHDRSYIHYVAEHTPWVAAKCWATKWALEGANLDYTKPYSSIEYFAGVGIMTTIIQNMFNISKCIVAERDLECYNQLRLNNWKAPTTSVHKDAKDFLVEENDFDLKFLDFPNSSILHLNKVWKDGFYKAFSTKPKLVMWTDTSVTYPMSIHGAKYSKQFGGLPVTSKEEYVDSMSKWVYNTFGYSISRAAFRARNAVYFVAIPGKLDPEMKQFDVEDNLSGFVIEGNDKGGIFDII